MAGTDDRDTEAAAEAAADEADQATRRKFLATATLALGGVAGAAVAYPLIRYLLFPMSHEVVDSPEEAVDVLAADELKAGAPPVRVAINASSARDGWAVAGDVPLGAAWLRRTEEGEITCFSSICPHLGCSIGFQPGDGDEPGTYRCPCHKSAFAVDGERLDGPSKRGLDPLPVAVNNGRVEVTFVRYRLDVAEREEV